MKLFVIKLKVRFDIEYVNGFPPFIEVKMFGTPKASETEMIFQFSFMPDAFHMYCHFEKSPK